MSLCKVERMAERMMGLNLYARNLVIPAKQEKNGLKYNGTIGTVYYMNQCTMPDGRVLQEQVQAESGEIGNKSIFVALRDEQGDWIAESLWSEDEMFLADL